MDQPNRFEVVNGQTMVPDSVGLIIPPSLFLLDDRVFMSLGLLKVAAVLQKAGSIVEVLDLSGIRNYLEAVADFVTSSTACVFGLTATTPQLPPVSEIVKVIRQCRPDARLVLGGPHVTLVNAALKGERKRGVCGRATEAMRELEAMFDVLVAGDGEDAVFAACHPAAPKVVDADERTSPFFLDNQRLGLLPWPARHLVDIESYKYSIDGAPALSLIAQLGCPFSCGFCGGRRSPMLRNIRMRSASNIVAEMEMLWRTTGRTGFMFYDDELNVNKGLVDLMRLIADKQKELGVAWRLRGFVKSELFTDEQAEAMYRAGFRWLLVGFESGAERILVNINKRATQNDNSRCVEIAHRHGLKVKALMSLGHPGETANTVEETKQWLLSVRPDDFDVTIITCYPGTPYYDEAVAHPLNDGVWVYTYPKTGDRLYQIAVDYTKTADYYKGDPDGGYRSYVYTDDLSADHLVVVRDAVERTVRQQLSIPFNPGAPGLIYEHSMGQTGRIPPFILRSSLTSPSL